MASGAGDSAWLEDVVAWVVGGDGGAGGLGGGSGLGGDGAEAALLVVLEGLASSALVFMTNGP